MTKTIAILGTTVEFASKQWAITAIESSKKLPNLHQHRLASGFDGNTYTVERIRTSKRQRACQTFLLRAAADGRWYSAL